LVVKSRWIKSRWINQEPALQRVWKIIKITHTHIHTNWFIVNKSTLRQIIKLYSLIYCMRSIIILMCFLIKKRLILCKNVLKRSYFPTTHKYLKMPDLPLSCLNPRVYYDFLQVYTYLLWNIMILCRNKVYKIRFYC